MNTNEEKYKITISWHEGDQTYFATVPALPGVAGHGDTPEEALECVKTSMRLWLKYKRDHDYPIPDPDAPEPRLDALNGLLNMSELARRTGINKFTLQTKLKRKTPLTMNERKAINRVLVNAGM